MSNKNIIDRIIKNTSENNSKSEILKTHKKAEKILVNAQEEAELIIEKANLFNEELKNQFEADLKKITNELSVSLKSQSQQSLSTALSAYAEEMRLAAESTRKTIEEQLITEQTKMKTQLQEFYESQKKLFQETVVKTADKLAKEYTGQVLNHAQHEKLIDMALQRAKEDGLFNNSTTENQDESPK